MTPSSHSSSPPSASSVGSRYSHLVDPIRDLASSWQIDLTNELEEYLAQLETIRIFAEQQQTQSQTQNGLTPDVGQKTINFAEAALLIQGSACIYSKKVEYLYSLLYQKLDSLIDKRKSKQQSSSINAAGEDIDALITASNDGVLLDLDDNIVEGEIGSMELPVEDDHVDLGDEHLSHQHARRGDTIIMRAPLSLLSDNIYDSVSAGMASKESSTGAALQQSLSQQFKISGCVMHSTGALLVESSEVAQLKHNDQLELDTSISGVNGSMNGPSAEPFGSPRGIMLESMAQEKRDAGIMALSFDEHQDDFVGGGGNDFHDDEENDLDHPRISFGGASPIGAAPPSIKKSVRFASELDDDDDDGGHDDGVSHRSRSLPSDDDLWAQLDPHDDSSLIPRPYRKGQTTRKPVLPDMGSLALSAELQLHLIQAMQHTQPAQAILLRGIAKQTINVCQAVTKTKEAHLKCVKLQ